MEESNSVQVESEEQKQLIPTNITDSTNKKHELNTSNACGEKDAKKEDFAVEVVQDHQRPFLYDVNESPPIVLLVPLALQLVLTAFDNCLVITAIVSDVTCVGADDVIRRQILSSTMMMVGVSTFLMCTVGVRLPIMQGPAILYIVNLAAMSNQPEWRCPDIITVNSTEAMAVMEDGSLVPNADVIYSKIGLISGSLMVAGLLHFLIGATGCVGVIARCVGPVTIVPTIVLVGLKASVVAVRFCEPSWIVTATTSITALVLALFLTNKNTPVPYWNSSKGFHIIWYPVHQLFAILLSLCVGWSLSAVLTSAGYFSPDPDDVDFLARTDAKGDVINKASWFTLPYPGQFGSFSFSSAAFVNFLIATLLSVLDSIGDYTATAKAVQVPTPPSHAFNRGLAVEGLSTVISGAMGCCHSTVSWGSPIGVIRVTRVVSRRVFQVTGLLYVLFACVGKLGAVFITVPNPVLGGIQVITVGMFIGVIFSYLQNIDLKSARNLSIIGIALLLGTLLPAWLKKNPNAIHTGVTELDRFLKMLVGNSAFVGLMFSMVMDNLAPGTRKQRGLADMDEASDTDKSPHPTDKQTSRDHTDKSRDLQRPGLEIFRLPFIPDKLRRSKAFKHIPIFDYQGS